MFYIPSISEKYPYFLNILQKKHEAFSKIEGIKNTKYWLCNGQTNIA